MQAVQRHAALLILPAAFVALALAGPALSDYALEIGFRLLLLITLAEAWNLLAGYGGLVSLGTASFFGIGAYALTGLVNQTGIPLALAIPAAGASAALLAALVSRAVFRLRGLYFTVGTLAAPLVCFSIAIRPVCAICTGSRLRCSRSPPLR
jgi:branched-chain amino acid transport system permease protein